MERVLQMVQPELDWILVCCSASLLLFWQHTYLSAPNSSKQMRLTLFRSLTYLSIDQRHFISYSQCPTNCSGKMFPKRQAVFVYKLEHCPNSSHVPHNEKINYLLSTSCLTDSSQYCLWADNWNMFYQIIYMGLFLCFPFPCLAIYFCGAWQQ